MEGVALCLARAVLGPSRRVASVTKTVVDSTGMLFVDTRSYCRLLMVLPTAAIWTYS